jgi:drug/metabolite transporter (DMT)-like permease
MSEVNFFQLVGGSVALFAATLVLEPTPPPASLPLAGILLWLGVVGTALAYGIWFWLLGRVPAARLSAYLFLVPVVALAASAALLGERLGTLQLFGVAAVVASIYGIGRGAGPFGRSTPS